VEEKAAKVSLGGGDEMSSDAGHMEGGVYRIVE
jgi:hypothetical protein